MNETKRTVLDWVHLPAGVEPDSYWRCLHDAILISCKTDLLARTVTLEFSVFYLKDGVTDLTFFITFGAVKSTRAIVRVRWPGALPQVEGLPSDESRRLLDEHYSKWSERSIDWHYFEEVLSTETYDILDANLASTGEQGAFQMGGILDGDVFDDQWCMITIQFGTVSASRSDGEPFCLSEFLEIGRSYWDTFGKR